MDINGVVGPQVLTDGTDAQFRLGREGALITAELHGRYHETGVRGKMFMLDSDSVTIAAANVTKGAVGTIKLINGFYNPSTSGVNASIVVATVATVSGTPGGPFFYNFLAQASTLIATGTIRSSVLGNSGSSMTPQVNAIITGSGTPSFLQAATMGGPAAVAATGTVLSIEDEVAGRLIVPPGVIFGIAATAAGTTHVVQSTLWWEEVPI